MFGQKLTTDNRLYKRWSVTAYKCYKRGCICDGCEDKLYCEVNGQKALYGMPHLKYTVIQLIKHLGKDGIKAFEEKLKNDSIPQTRGNTKY